MTLTLDRTIHRPKAIAIIVATIPGLAQSIIPKMIQAIPDNIPSNGMKNLLASKSRAIISIPYAITKQPAIILNFYYSFQLYLKIKT